MFVPLKLIEFFLPRGCLRKYLHPSRGRKKQKDDFRDHIPLYCGMKKHSPIPTSGNVIVYPALGKGKSLKTRSLSDCCK